MSYAVLVRFSLAKYSVDSVMDSAQIDNVCKYIGVKTIKKKQKKLLCFISRPVRFKFMDLCQIISAVATRYVSPAHRATHVIQRPLSSIEYEVSLDRERSSFFPQSHARREKK